MQNQKPSEVPEKGKKHSDNGFYNEPDDPNNPNEVREKFEREVMEEGKVPDEHTTPRNP